MEELAAKYVLFDFEIIVLTTLVLGIALYELLRRIRRKHPVGPHYFDRFDLLLMIFPAFFYLVSPILNAMVETPTPPAEKTEGGGQVVLMLVNLAFIGFVGILTYAILAWGRGYSVRKVCGLHRMTFPMIVVFTILGGIMAFFLCSVFLGGISQNFLNGVFGKLNEQEPVEMFKDSSSLFHLGLSIFVACIAAPLVEEFLFRGYMYGVVKKYTSPVFAAFVIGGIFAVAHGNLPALMPLWAFAVFLTIAYEITGCLWVPVGIHAFFNLANVILLLNQPNAVEAI